jgi:molybdopterin biosynthesis enzyme MoaB
MRTTVDIPQDLLRRAKAEAALRGMSLKDYVNEAIRAALGDAHVAEADPVYVTGDRLALEDGCVFPLIKGPAGPALRDLTPEKVHEILEQEEIDRELSRDSG